MQRGLKSIPGVENSHILGSRSLSRVELVGTIVRVTELDHLIKYTLDDTTGLVDCTQWKARRRRFESKNNAHGTVANGMAVSMGGDLVPSFTLPHNDGAGSISYPVASLPFSSPVFSQRAFQLGDMVRVRGKLHKVPEQYLQRFLCFSDREISISSMKRVGHVHEAIHHRLTAIQLSNNFYNNSNLKISSQAMNSD